MYCVKLKEILKSDISIKHKIDISIVQKLDLFLRKYVTFAELNNLNPVRFSYEMNVDYHTTIRLFSIGKNVGLFEPLAFYRCKCGEKFELYSFNDETECPNGCNIIPKQDKERIYVYFDLKYEVEECDFIEHDIYLADIIDEDELGKSVASYSDFEEVLGEEGADDLINKRRKDKFREFLGR